MDQILVNNVACGLAIAKLARTDYNPDSGANICRVRDGVRMGGVIFTNYTHESIGMHAAGFQPRWVSRELIFKTFYYPFNQLGVKRIFGQVAEDNLHAIEFNLKVGFKPVARVEGVYPGPVACIVMCLEREDCRLLNVRPLAMAPSKTVN